MEARLKRDSFAGVIRGHCEGGFPRLAIKQRAHEGQNIILQLESDVGASQSVTMVLERILVVLPISTHNSACSIADDGVPDDNFVPRMRVRLILGDDEDIHMVDIPAPHLREIYGSS